MKQLTGNRGWDIPHTAAAQVAILKIEITTITGKISGL